MCPMASSGKYRKRQSGRENGLRKTERQIQALRDRWTQSKPTSDEQQAALLFLSRLVQAVRVDLMDNWDGEIEASFLFFDYDTRSLAVLAAALVGDQTKELDYGPYRMPYGMGIAGRAFKANRIRIYAPPRQCGFGRTGLLLQGFPRGTLACRFGLRPGPGPSGAGKWSLWSPLPGIQLGRLPSGGTG